MTLEEIIKRTLENLNEDSDEDTVSEYRERIVAFANEAYLEICKNKYQPEKEEEVQIGSDGLIPASALPDGFFQATELWTVNGAPLRFVTAEDGIRAHGYEGGAVLRYRYLPEELELDSAVPIFEAGMHYCLADYAAWRIMMTGSKQRQTRGEAFYNSYLLALTKITPQKGLPLRIKNKF